MELLNNLLKSAIIFGKKFAELTVAAQIAVGAILIFASYQLTSCSKDQEIQNIKIEAEKTTQYAKQAKDSVKVLADSVEKTQVTINKLKFEISLQKRQRAALQVDQHRLEKQIVVETDTVTILALQDTTIDNLKTQLSVVDSIVHKKDSIITHQDTTIGLLKYGLNLSEKRADTLQTTLNSTIKKLNKKDKMFGFIPLPNRKVVAATALIGGVYLGTQLKK